MDGMIEMQDSTLGRAVRIFDLNIDLCDFFIVTLPD